MSAGAQAGPAPTTSGWTASRVQRLRRLRSAGLTPVEIARRLDADPESVRCLIAGLAVQDLAAWARLGRLAERD